MGQCLLTPTRRTEIGTYSMADNCAGYLVAIHRMTNELVLLAQISRFFRSAAWIRPTLGGNDHQLFDLFGLRLPFVPGRDARNDRRDSEAANRDQQEHGEGRQVFRIWKIQAYETALHVDESLGGCRIVPRLLPGTKEFYSMATLPQDQ